MSHTKLTINPRPDSYNQAAGMEKGRSESVNLNRNVTAKSVTGLTYSLMCSC